MNPLNRSALPVVKKFPLGVAPKGITEELVIADGWHTFIIFDVWNIGEDSRGGDFGFALIECVGCQSSKFGYPNDEGQPEHPLYPYTESSGGGIFIARNTPYLNETLSQIALSSERIWGERGAETEPEQRQALAHFIFFLKESTFECIADDVVIRGLFDSRREASTRAFELLC